MLRIVVSKDTFLIAYHAYNGTTLKYAILFQANSKKTTFIAQKKNIGAVYGIGQTDLCKLHFKSLKL